MFKSLAFNVKKIDIFAKPISFVLDGEEKFRTWWGFFFSLLTLIATITLAFLFGSEVYERKTPITTQSTTFIEKSSVDFQEFPLFIMFSDGLGNKYDNLPEYLDVRVQNWHFQNNAFTHIFEEDEETGAKHIVERCEMKHFQSVREKLGDEAIYDVLNTIPIFCIVFTDFDGNNLAVNPYKAANSTFVHFTFSFCNPNLEICPDNMDIVEAESYIQFFYIESYVDSNDYHNPIKYYINSVNQQMSQGFLKRNFIRFANNEYTADNGWMLEEKIVHNFINLDSIKLEINGQAIDDMQKGEIYWITIESPQLKTSYFRNYLKIQELFAKIGGLINAIMIIVKYLFNSFT